MATTAKPYLFADEIFRMIPKPFIVSKMFVEESFNLIIGPKKTGKTLLTVDLVLSMAAGLPEWRATESPNTIRVGW
jgi:RecA-family ATPase